MSQDSAKGQPENNAPGALLKQARLKTDLTTDQVAARMNLTTELIDNIERDNYQKNISPAFYRGYLRSYAQIVDLDADDLIQNYNHLIDQGSLSASITPTFDTNLYTRKERNIPYLKWIMITGSVALVLFIVYFVWTKKFSSKNNPQAEIVISEVQSGSGETISLSGLEDDLTVPEPETVARQADNDSEAVEQVEAEDKPVSAPENAQLQMDFQGDCWVKVTDSNGEVLALGIKRAGKSMDLQGLAPFKIIMGNSAVVSMKFNQQNVNLSGFEAGNRVEIQLSSDSELLQ